MYFYYCVTHLVFFDGHTGVGPGWNRETLFLHQWGLGVVMQQYLQYM